ncbi:MAG: dihydropteroate synthase [Acidimicrobiales bacterium]
MFLDLGAHRFDITYRALVMGILNRTPDSFFDAGQYWDFDDFLSKAEKLVDDGVDFLDVGGVKAGPGDEVDLQEELERVVPAVEALRRRFDVPISVDTWRAEVLRQCIETGADIGNDISGFADPDYLAVAAAGGASVVATHIRLAPRVPDPDPVYDDLVGDVRAFLDERAGRALTAGIPRERIIIDAGLDLGKTPRMSWELLHRSDALVDLGYPLLLSASNKRFLFELLETERTDIESGTTAAHVIGIAKGCRVIRAHDVQAGRRVADMMAEILAVRARA